MLRGSWPFSSGVDACEWNMLASVVSSDDEADGIEYRIFLINKRDYKINDTWNATGLRGTGSNDVEVDDAFVAAPMTVAVNDLGGGPTPGSATNPNPLYSLPVFSLFPFVLSGVALGNAQACLDDYVEVARHRVSTYNRTKLGDLQSTQIKIAEASAKIDAARRIMRSNCIEAMADARRGLVPDIAAKTRLRRDGAYSVNLCTEAVSLLFAASGARGLFTTARCSGSFAMPTPSTRTSRSTSMRLAPITAALRWPALRKPDAVSRPMTARPSIRPIRPMSWPATTPRSIHGISAMRWAPMPPASPSSRQLRPTAGPMD